MSRINRVPRGLLDLLGNTNMGDNPSNLSEMVAPVIGMEPFYKVERRAFDIDAGAVTVSTSSQISQFIVPDGELWLVDWIGSTVSKGSNFTIGDEITVSADLQNLAGSSSPTIQHPLAQTVKLEPIATASNFGILNGAHHFARPLALQSGDTLVFWASSVVRGASPGFSVRNCVAYTRLTV